MDTNNNRKEEYECSYEVEAPRVYYDRLSSVLKECPSLHSQQQPKTASGCSACDERFFTSLSAEVASVTHYFNKKVQWLLQVEHASGFKKAVLKVKHKQVRNHAAMIQESQNLLKYASIMTLAAHALLQDYDMIHESSEGVHFKARLVGAHKEFLQSPWLIELLALYFNIENGEGCQSLPELCLGCKCDASSDKLTLACMPHESLKVEIEATCSICLEILGIVVRVWIVACCELDPYLALCGNLWVANGAGGSIVNLIPVQETVFDPLALSCGHYFCFSCACSTASVHTYEKLAETKVDVKCPMCRETSAFASAIRLTELNLLAYTRCKDYWKARRQRERKDRLNEIKDYWTYTSQ